MCDENHRTPEGEIEVTSDMVDTLVGYFYDFNPSADDPRRTARLALSECLKYAGSRGHPDDIASAHVASVAIPEEPTPEMIEAGVDELLGHDIYVNSDFSGPSMEAWREAVADTFKAMISARG